MVILRAIAKKGPIRRTLAFVLLVCVSKRHLGSGRQPQVSRSCAVEAKRGVTIPNCLASKENKNIRKLEENQQNLVACLLWDQSCPILRTSYSSIHRCAVAISECTPKIQGTSGSALAVKQISFAAFGGVHAFCAACCSPDMLYWNK